jgi:hypothetical protein
MVRCYAAPSSKRPAPAEAAPWVSRWAGGVCVLHLVNGVWAVDPGHFGAPGQVQVCMALLANGCGRGHYGPLVQLTAGGCLC